MPDDPLPMVVPHAEVPVRFALSPEHEQFAGSMHDLLASSDVPSIARQWAAGQHGPGRQLWRELAAMGVAALLVPENWAGSAGPPRIWSWRVRNWGTTRSRGR